MHTKIIIIKQKKKGCRYNPTLFFLPHNQFDRPKLTRMLKKHDNNWRNDRKKWRTGGF
jgi:hypothetical protein